MPFFFCAYLCCQNPRNGAIPVPGPTSINGFATSSGKWKFGALRIEKQTVITFVYSNNILVEGTYLAIVDTAPLIFNGEMIISGVSRNFSEVVGGGV